MFEKGMFHLRSRAALKEKDTHAAVRELVATAVSQPAHVVRVFGEPQRAGVETIYRADDLTILNLCWGPRMKFKPPARERHDPAGRSDYSRCYQPTGSDYGGDPRLPRRFLCHALAANGILRRLKSAPYDVEDTMRAFEMANERLCGKVPRS
jgi:hypothetical protein